MIAIPIFFQKKEVENKMRKVIVCNSPIKIVFRSEDESLSIFKTVTVCTEPEEHVQTDNQR